MELYSVSWTEWKLEERLQTMRDLGIRFILHPHYCIQLEHGLSSGQREAFDFLRDPVHPVIFTIFDYWYGRTILKLHNEFWNWRFYPSKEDSSA